MKVTKFNFLVLFFLLACQLEPEETTSGLGAFISPGDIVVSSNSADSAILLDKNGGYKAILYNPNNNLDQVYGLAWNNITQEVVVSINGTPDRLMAISAIDGSVREAVRDAQFNGNTFGVAVDEVGDYFAIESNNIEKFDATGIRINNGTFPRTNLMTTLSMISSLSTGGFVGCSTGTDRVRTYDGSFTQQNETASGIAGTTNSYGCMEMANGNIAASWDGTTDTVVIYDNTLSSTGNSFTDSSYLSTPRGIGARANGNILVADTTYDWLVELGPDANFIRTLGSGLLNDPWQVLVIPEF